MKSRNACLASAGALATAVVLAAAPAQGSQLAKAFPAGCWIGKAGYSGTYASGPMQAKVTNGTQSFVLWVSKDGADAIGFILVKGSGAGTLKVSGSTLALKVKILGDYDLTGTASAVKANGFYSMTGTAKGTGQFLPSVPVKLKYPVKNAAVTLKTVTQQKVTGLFGKAPWSATRRAGAPSKAPDACSDAA
jgi:hypothetical protein